MKGSTDEDLEAALLLIQLISSSSRRDAAVGKLKLGDEEESENGSTAAAHASPSSPSSNKKILRRKKGSFGERERELSRSARAQVRRRIQKEMKAAGQLLQLSEEEGEGGETGSFNSEPSYLTDASSAVAMETRVDQERGSEGKQRGGGGEGSKSDRRCLSRVCIEEEREDDFPEDECLAAIFCRKSKKRKFRPLADIYAATNA